MFRGLIELRKNAKQAVKAVLIPLPSLDEQREVVRILKQIFENEEKAKVDIEEFIDAIDLMKKSILAKAFRGELGTNISDEESSIELLKSILT